ncbi:MAG: aminopeptidase N [Ornithinimicrobium sp.]|uniref:aminopeptidase N n=1 Tax=Ornithinimicrobium sp. TaxID=1977084 RepID=UPI0026DF0266|nr:aminopeptidase N [Ornithinimicrobium sp.]MDO5738695.1 aminopeptidase N [Ornithinimicrobium sp.]
MSLTLQDARARSATVHDVSYEIHLDVTGEGEFFARTRVRFAAEPGASTFLDLQHATDVKVWLNGERVQGQAYRQDQVHLSGLATANEAVVEARLPYVTDGDGLHRFVDPVDGAVYLGAYGGMDVARRVFACFDQPDLKATFALSVRTTPGITALSNGTGRLTAPAEPDGGAHWTFEPTPPISTYLVAVCIGPWASRTWEHAGLEFGWHARASQVTDLDRDLPDLRRVTEAAYDDYARRFTQPYAFGAYHQVFVPGHNWGAMETPGCVTFRDELLPAGSTPQALQRGRAMIIAHEMAHMWFGDLVTFRWWEDTWLNESFADYLGFLVGGHALGGGTDTFGEFDISRKAGGYAADARPSSHPVAPFPEDVPDVDSAFNNFDAISYAKGNSCVRQLAFWLGEETFFAGVNRHLTQRRFGTASLADFVMALEGVTDRDVPGWVEAWLRTSGHDTIRVVRGDGPGPGAAGGSAPRLRREGSRPHRLRVHGYSSAPGGGLVRDWGEVVDLGADDVTLRPADLVVPNSTGDTFARVVLDEVSMELVEKSLCAVPDEHPRIMVWATLLDAAATADLAPAYLVGLVEDHLPQEGAPVVIEHVLRRAVGIVAATASPGEVSSLYERLAQVALQILTGQAADSAAVVESAAGAVLATTHDASLLRDWLAETESGPRLSQVQRWQALVRLSGLGEDVAADLAAEQVRDRSSAAGLAALSVAAAAPTRAAAREALERLLADDTSNRELGALAEGLWLAEQRPLVDPLVAPFLDGARTVARRGQALALVVGRCSPAFRWTPAQLAALEAILAEGDLPPVLARTWADLLYDQRRIGDRD